MVFTVNADCRYDKDHEMTWNDVTVSMKMNPLKAPNETDREPTIAEAMLWVLLEADLEDDDIFDFDDDPDGPEHDVPPAEEGETAFLTQEEEQ